MGKISVWFLGTAILLFIGYATVSVATQGNLWYLIVLHIATISFGAISVITGTIYMFSKIRHSRSQVSETAFTETHLNSLVQQVKTYEEDKGWENGKPIGECGLIFINTSDANLVGCHVKLIDLVYETPHKHYGLDNYPKVETLICDKTIPAFGSGKIPLFRWKGAMIDKSLSIIYEKKDDNIGYSITNIPILVLLNIWADNVPAAYVVCRLSDRLGWGYGLSILKSGLQKENPKLSVFQIKASGKKDPQTE